MNTLISSEHTGLWHLDDEGNRTRPKGLLGLFQRLDAWICRHRHKKDWVRIRPIEGNLTDKGRSMTVLHTCYCGCIHAREALVRPCTVCNGDTAEGQALCHKCYEKSVVPVGLMPTIDRTRIGALKWKAVLRGDTYARIAKGRREILGQRGDMVYNAYRTTTGVELTLEILESGHLNLHVNQAGEDLLLDYSQKALEPLYTAVLEAIGVIDLLDCIIRDTQTPRERELERFARIEDLVIRTRNSQIKWRRADSPEYLAAVGGFKKPSPLLGILIGTCEKTGEVIELQEFFDDGIHILKLHVRLPQPWRYDNTTEILEQLHIAALAQIAGVDLVIEPN